MEAIIVIGGSSGGLKPLRAIIRALQPDSSASIFVVIHIGNQQSYLHDILARDTKIPVAAARDGDLIKPGHIYVAPPDYHMILDFGLIRLHYTSKIHFTRPAVDPLFESAAATYGDRVVGIVLSGGDGDGAQGLRAIKEHGGKVFVQDPTEAEVSSMPDSALNATDPNAWLPMESLANCIRNLAA